MATTTLYGPIRAGRAIRESDSTNKVVSQPALGEITITENDDGLVHFNWTNRQSGNTEIDLIVFPSDATFVPVSQAPGGRVHVLKFSSSDQRHFFWFQDNHTGAHASYARNINGLLEDPDYTVDHAHASDAAGRSAAPTTGGEGGSQASVSGPAPSSASASAGVGSPAPAGAAGAGALGGLGAGNPTPEQLEAFRQLVARLPSSSSSSANPNLFTGGMPDLALSDLLTPSTLAPLFNSSSSSFVLQSILPTLPSDILPSSSSSPQAQAATQIVRRVVESPQFQAQVRSLDRALSTGLVGGLMGGLGLGAEAGLGVGPFLEAVRRQAQEEKGDGDGEEGMEED